MSVPALRLLIVLAALALLAPSASARTLKIATVVPDGSSWLVEMRKAGKEIEERTESRVKLKFYPGGVMGNDKTVLRKLRAGQLQGGAFTSGALAAIYPDIELYSLPLLFRNYEEVDLVRTQLDQQLKDGLEEKGFVALSITDGGFAYVLSQKPMGRVEDMSGAKVWLVEDDKMSEIALELAGVSPVPLPIADVYTALQTGLIDTVAAPPMAAIAFQWHTKIRYLTDEPLMYLTGVVAIDRKAFDKISKADQAVVREVVAAAGDRLDADNRAGEDNARDALRNQGIDFVKPSSAEEVGRWHDISAEAIEKLRTMGRYDDATIQKIQSILQNHRTGPAASR
ncbi:MAG: TRAP transporter substrate-binding protein DctP [Deltaproteobacteria bacterium]|nr:TRAP transporter substrate-binding protein DctP [Deltaproteobacteria bacterium]MBW2382495.1 TRAP transporter substrate-binding protein DctP [Deltaproteobacteria bacterium]MBW2694976.1 TRAP transporter substrate-binding protein DctP [Deltaproteobacteria bacterium]